jgi:hypothetical protein
LYLSVIAFNLTMAVIIGEMTIAVTGFFIVFLPLTISIIGIIRRTNRYHRDELADSLRDYPMQSVPERET